MSHRGREQAAPRAAPAVRTYTCSSPASSPPPCITQKGRGQRSHHNTQSAAEAARRHRGPIQRLYRPSGTTKGCARCSTHQVACWPSCLAKLHFPHSHSSSCIALQYIAGRAQQRSSNSRALTLPGASSTSDKGRTDSRTAPVRTAPPAAESQDPLGPSSAAPQNTR